MAERLLIVEDDKNQQFLYEQELIEEGYEVHVASNSDEAMDAIRTNDYDLVILDICMPGKDGIETLSEIMEYNNKIPVILNTAYSTYKDNYMTWSADAYVVKSSDLTELKNTIRNILNNNEVQFEI